ncbi:energy-coupling factor transporter transmembrane component T family protein [Bartonella clarridgeiae]|uniref:energy-coupling factor transporter transmembrane component T family protein n=1 Tax=Bartonella clarridgeiae TaxID=56426 RepID=UPI0002E7713C|nr:energy-coupling factor transporter transmembrane protein EcfT [Bartonella clarridgeiae]WCR55495.1 MAG: Transmembrane component BioN of energizing module of biotin ECF transporter [Bartonella clarridgeiae]
MISSYIPHDTLIHRLRPGTKLLFLILCGTIIFMVSSISAFLLFLLFISSLYRIAKIPFNKIIKQFKPVWLFLVFIFIFESIFDNWLTGFSIILRFIILISLASLISLTTKVSDMVASIEVGFRSFQCLGINPSKLSMVLSMAIRFIPVISEKFNAICEAQRARGLDINIIALAIPLIIRTIRIASEVAEALDARSYDSDDKTL